LKPKHLEQNKHFATSALVTYIDGTRHALMWTHMQWRLNKLTKTQAHQAHHPNKTQAHQVQHPNTHHTTRRHSTMHAKKAGSIIEAAIGTHQIHPVGFMTHAGEYVGTTTI
jgi:hypothetical protein